MHDSLVDNEQKTGGLPLAVAVAVEVMSFILHPELVCNLGGFDDSDLVSGIMMFNQPMIYQSLDEKNVKHRYVSCQAILTALRWTWNVFSGSTYPNGESQDAKDLTWPPTLVQNDVRWLQFELVLTLWWPGATADLAVATSLGVVEKKPSWCRLFREGICIQSGPPTICPN